MSANIKAITATLEQFERDASLRAEENFSRREAASDWLEFNIVDEALQARAAKLQERFQEIDEQIFHRLREQIRAGQLRGERLRNELVKYAGNGDGTDYTALDSLVNGVLRLDAPPQETLPRETEMVFYQPTPARIVLDLIDAARISAQDVFYDLGSGLGHVCILVNLLTGAKTLGVEYEPAFCDYAQRCVNSLNLHDVDFVNRDARDVDYAAGTIFFLYTPFRGKILQTVLRKLEMQKRKIRVATFGACSPVVARERWLNCIAQKFSGEYEFAVFTASVIE